MWGNFLLASILHLSWAESQHPSQQKGWGCPTPFPPVTTSWAGHHLLVALAAAGGSGAGRVVAAGMGRGQVAAPHQRLFRRLCELQCEGAARGSFLSAGHLECRQPSRLCPLMASIMSPTDELDVVNHTALLNALWGKELSTLGSTHHRLGLPQTLVPCTPRQVGTLMKA